MRNTYHRYVWNTNLDIQRVSRHMYCCHRMSLLPLAPVPRGELQATTTLAGCAIESYRMGEELKTAANDSSTFSVVPVSLREAVLDSPSFRAHVRHLETQVDALEKWLDKYLQTSKKFLAHLEDMEDIAGKIFSAGALSGVDGGIIDGDYTFMGIESFAEGMRLFWTQIFMKGRDATERFVNPLKTLLNVQFSKFKSVRRDFHTAQDKYDASCIRFASLSKSKEASSIREDAFQLFEARKLYFKHASNLPLRVAQFRAEMDQALVAIFAEYFSKNFQLTSSTGSSLEQMRHDMNKLLSWSNHIAATSDKLFERIEEARAGFETSYLKDTEPERDLSTYSSDAGVEKSGRERAVSSAALTQFSRSPSKQGWLFSKSFAGKPARTSWTHRWVFIQDGTLGWLNNPSKGGFVEQSDKIGVLLCNSRSVTMEDRRFVFEIQTRQSTLTFQAETEHDMRDWLDTLEAAKKAALSSPDRQAHAFAITPSADPSSSPSQNSPDSKSVPRASVDVPSPEGSLNGTAKPSKSKPIQPGLVKFATAAGQAVLAQHQSLFTNINTSNNDHRHTPIPNMAPALLAPAPIDTDYSNKSLHAEPSEVAPSASQSNYWGSVYWASRNVENGAQNADIVSQSSTDSPRSRSMASTSLVTPRQSFTSDRNKEDLFEYPKDYPVQLRSHDYQFRSLFSPVEGREFVLVVSRVLWSPTEESLHISGRLYLTANGIYLYAYNYGLVCLQSLSFKEIVHIGQYDELPTSSRIVIRRHQLDPIIIHLILDSANLLTRILQMVFENSMLTDPVDGAALLSKIKSIQKQQEAEMQPSHAEELPKPAIIPTEKPRKAPAIQWPTKPVECDCASHLDAKFFDKEFDLSTKGMFHLLFGDNSPIWPRVYKYKGVRQVEQGPWKAFKDDKFRREWNYLVDLKSVAKKFTSAITEIQTIERRQDNLLYVATVRYRPWHLPRSEEITLVTQYCISFVAPGRTRLKIHTGLEWAKASVLLLGMMTYCIMPAYIIGILKSKAKANLEDVTAKIVAEIESEASKLGPNASDSRALKLYGQVGLIKEIQKRSFDRHNKPREQQSLQENLMDVFNTDRLGTIGGLLEETLHIPSNTLEKVGKYFSAHWLLVFICVTSVLFNFYIPLDISRNYFQHRNAERTVQGLLHGESSSLSRAIFLRDIDDLVHNKTLLGDFSGPW